jgi:hypothetical protein
MVLDTPIKKFIVFFLIFIFQLYFKIIFGFDRCLLAAGGDDISSPSSESSSAVQPKSTSSSRVPSSAGALQVSGRVRSPTEVSTPNPDYVRPASLEGREARLVSGSSADRRYKHVG